MDAFHYFLRKMLSRFMLVILTILSSFAIIPFFYIVYYVFQNGISAINWDFFTSLPKSPGETGGGLANGILGSVTIVGMTCLVGVPWGIFLGVSLSEYHHNLSSRILRFIIDLAVSTPSIVIGIFVYNLIVVYFGFSAYAGSVSLLFILVPIIARSTEEILQLVPQHIREAGLALGIPRWKVIMRILIPGTITMLLSGVILAIARIAGETAPLLFTSLGNQFFSKSLSEPTASLPIQIYEYAKSGFPSLEAMAWGGALVLISFVFIVNFFTRFTIFLVHRSNHLHGN